VDITDASYSNSIGDPYQPQNAECTSGSSRIRLQIRCVPFTFFHVAGVYQTGCVSQERAYTSPVWYTPAK
jgi:hypothetical protein